MSSSYQVRDLLHTDAPTVEVAGEEIPIAAETEIVVAGGGPAGAMAAIAAGRQGAEVILIEAQPFLGGIETGGTINWYYYGVDGGIQDEMERRSSERDALVSTSTGSYHPEMRKVVFEQMADDAGVTIWLRAVVTGAIMDGDTMRGVIVDGEPGRIAVLCKVCVDATGDGDLAAFAGAEFALGREGDGLPMAYSLTPGVSRDGRVISHSNFDVGWVDPTDPWDYARGFVDGRKFLWRDPYNSENRLHFCAPTLGVRESRQVIGDYVLTLDDLYFGQCFPDTIGKCRAHYDNHARDYVNEGRRAQVYADVTGNWKTTLTCDVPYRSLLVKGIEGLLTAGRCISMTHDAEACLRMQKDMHRLGEAAGIAAALAVRDGITPREIAVGQLQRELVKSGVLTKAELTDGAAGKRRELRPVEELMGELAGARVAPAMYELYCHGETAFPALREAVGGEDREVARWAALVLGAHGEKDARAALVEMLVARDETAPPGQFVQPRWIGALVCLIDMATPELAEQFMAVLAVERGTPSHLLYALKGLGRAGNRDAVPAIHAFLKRLRADETLWGPTANPITSPGWKLELIAAEALIALDDEEGIAIARRYADDPRLLVRRYARKLLTPVGQDNSGT